MRLSEAVRLGSLLVPEPKMADIGACAITMAVKATGDVEKVSYYRALITRWPWLTKTAVECPCGKKCGPPRISANGYYRTGILYDESILWIPFDNHVMGDRTMTIEQLADWISRIEPKEVGDDGRTEETAGVTPEALVTHVSFTA